MKITSSVKDYDLEVVDNVFTFLGDPKAPGQSNRPFYFIDRKIYDLYKAPVQALIGKNPFLLIDADEKNKSYLKLADYYTALIDGGFSRKDTLITFGGGIIQDISGFIASTLYRGIKWIYVPTTLLAQADSCIGSKTSINFGDSKNLIGTFYPPDLILVDGKFINTLNAADFNSGLGEIIKFHLLSDPKHYALLKEFLAHGDLKASPLFRRIIESTLDIKKSYFETDEFDTGRRNLLNYGHCYGHALESASNFAIAHGEAVMVGMGFANLLALKRGILSQGTYDEFEAILKKFYPNFALKNIPVERLIEYLKRDKKRVSVDLTMILARGLGDCVKCDDVKEHEVIAVHEEFARYYDGIVNQHAR